MSYTSVQNYIDSSSVEHQTKLLEIRKAILDVLPKEATETIAYQMPTYKLNGNLIHFALFKNHIGLYPGPAALEHFSDEIYGYKTTKGALQLPLDQPLPINLIQGIVEFNLEKQKDKKAPNWHEYRHTWPEAYTIMEEVIDKTDLKKEFKWGTDIYTLNGKNVVGWSGFKDFFSIWFYNGVFLEDKQKVLVNASEGKTKALRQWRFKNADEMDPKKILAYINESIQTILDGKEIKPEKSKILEIEGVLKEILDEDTSLKEAFDRLTPGKKKEYIEYINEAKQEKTKYSRIEKITPLILAGKSLNDKYKR